MNIEKDLEKDGISCIEPLDTLSTTLIAKFVAEKLSCAFSVYGLVYDSLFFKVSKIPMYTAIIPEDMAEANYFYKNSSIYFKQGLKIEDMQELAIHEFIHSFQEIKDNKNYLHRLGLCDYTKMKVNGLALNEGSVQYFTAKALKSKIDTVKYYGIEFPTNSPNYYPLLCNLIKQMSYITGEEVLFNSTFFANDKFKKAFISLCGENTFYEISHNFDLISSLEEKLSALALQKQDNIDETKLSQITNKMEVVKNKIQNTFIITQNMILKSYFDREFEKIHFSYKVEDYRKKLYYYKDLIGTIEGYHYYNDYYINKMNELANKYDNIDFPNQLVPYKTSFISRILYELRKLVKNLKNVVHSQDIK